MAHIISALYERIISFMLNYDIRKSCKCRKNSSNLNLRLSTKDASASAWGGGWVRVL